MSTKELYENKLQVDYFQMTISDFKKIFKNTHQWVYHFLLLIDYILRTMVMN